jgi:hypothetical protein
MIAKEGPATGTHQEQWMILCEQAQEAQDPQKLTEVLATMDRMLQEKQDRRTGGRVSQPGYTGGTTAIRSNW